MRIALVHNLPSGGAKRHTFEQVKELERRGRQAYEHVMRVRWDDVARDTLGAYLKQ